MPPWEPTIRDVSPCKGCEERFPACQDRCPIEERGGYGYPSWKAEIERVKKNRKDYMAKPFSKIT